MDQVRAAVVVPKRARVDPAFGLFYEQGLRPLAGRVACFGHVDAEVGVAVIDIKLARVIPDRRRPNAAAMLGFAKDVVRFLLGENVVYDPPVYEVLRVQNRQPGRGVKARSGHVEIVADAHGVRVGIVGVDDRDFCMCRRRYPGPRPLRRFGRRQRRRSKKDRKAKGRKRPERTHPCVQASRKRSPCEDMPLLTCGLAQHLPLPRAAVLSGFRSGGRAWRRWRLRGRARASRGRCCGAARPIASGPWRV